MTKQKEKKKHSSTILCAESMKRLSAKEIAYFIVYLVDGWFPLPQPSCSGISVAT